MYNPDSDLVTLEEIHTARRLLQESPHFLQTPMLSHVQRNYGIHDSVDLHIKLENMQVTGSFKIRGVLNQLQNLPQVCEREKKTLISMSAGNYGKAFAYMTSQIGLKAVLLMPDTAPSNRATLIKRYGVTVMKVPSPRLQREVDKYVLQHNMLYLHPFDDIKLIAGYGSLGLEILAEVPEPDIVLVCCGGGGCLSGTAAAIKLMGHRHCKIYGVEPEGWSNTFKHCKEFVEDILLVSDEEILSSMFCLYEKGILAEPSGAAAFAALYHRKVPDVMGKRVVTMVTGGNITVEELYQLSNQRK